MEACSMRFGEIHPARTGPNRNKKQPWITMPFFSYRLKERSGPKAEQRSGGRECELQLIKSERGSATCLFVFD